MRVLARLLVSGLWPGLASSFLIIVIVLLVNANFWIHIKVCREPTKIREEIYGTSPGIHSPSTLYLDSGNTTSCQSTLLSVARPLILLLKSRCRINEDF